MKTAIHRAITRQVLEGKFSDPVLETILEANAAQDRLSGQIGHPYYHFDDDSFDEAKHYINVQRTIIIGTLAKSMDPTPAWCAFGRLTHAVQDFYAHSNYVALWLHQSSNHNGPPPPGLIDPLDAGLIGSPELRSGHIYLMDWASSLPLIGPGVKYLLPHNAHAWMNLDYPERGSLFPYALEAAKKRTAFEFQEINLRIQTQVGYPGLSRFSGLGTPI